MLLPVEGGFQTNDVSLLRNESQRVWELSVGGIACARSVRFPQFIFNPEVADCQFTLKTLLEARPKARPSSAKPAEDDPRASPKARPSSGKIRVMTDIESFLEMNRGRWPGNTAAYEPPASGTQPKDAVPKNPIKVELKDL